VARKRTLRACYHFESLLPLWGGLQTLAACEETSACIGALLSGGVPLPKALEVAGNGVSNPCFGDALGRVARDVARGESLSTSLTRQRMFPPLLAWTAALGEKSERLDQTMLDLAGYYREKLSRVTRRGVALWQPVLVFCIGQVVACYVLALFLPLYQLIGAL
jgi:type II secretory pathway component PulF